MFKVVSNENEIIINAMLNRDNPFTVDDIMEEFGRGRIAIFKYIKALTNSEKLFKQDIGRKKYFINVEKLNPVEIVDIANCRCAYRVNDKVAKIMCEITYFDESKEVIKLQCKNISNCSIYHANFDRK